MKSLMYAYIYDVMTGESLVIKNTTILNKIITYPELAKVKYIELTCTTEMTEFYNRFGFNNSFANTIPMRLSRN